MTDVLIIDDNPTIRAILRTMIQGDDYRVVGEAGNGAQGLERALELNPDIVCLDIVMPGEDGLHVLLKLKDELPQTAVLMVTGKNDRDTVASAISRGASGFILKPFKIGTVLDTLAQTVASMRKPARLKSLATNAGDATGAAEAAASA